MTGHEDKRTAGSWRYYNPVFFILMDGIRLMLYDEPAPAQVFHYLCWPFARTLPPLLVQPYLLPTLQVDRLSRLQRSDDYVHPGHKQLIADAP